MANKLVIYSYEGKNRQGKNVVGELEVAGEAQLKVILRKQGITVTKLKRKRQLFGQKLKPIDISIMTRQFATMLRTGVPIMVALDIMSKSANNALMRKLLNNIRNELETGSSLNQALRKHPEYFDALYVNLVSAGEQAGVLETLMDRLATYREKTEKIKQSIKSAMMYPMIVVIVAGIVVGIIMVFVVPAFKGAYESFGGELPLPTQIVVVISEFLQKYWYIAIGLAIGGYLAIKFIWKQFAGLRRLWSVNQLKMPVFGQMIKDSIIARFCRTLSTLFAAGVPLVDALPTIGKSTGNVLFEEASDTIRKDISVGNPLTSSLQKTGLFPQMVIQLLTIGEESGTLDSMAGKAAEFYEEKVDKQVEGISASIEPLMIVFLGIIIGGLVVALYLPIFGLADHLG